MSTPEGFHYFINHLKERLVIILDYNVENGIDPCETDLTLLRELCDMYDKEVIDTYSEEVVSIIAEQRSLFESIMEE